MNCKNCDQIVDGKFCSQCGQNSKVGKVNLSNFLEEITSSIFQIDKGIIYTIKELLTRPGFSIKDFLNGKRKNHFKPVAYVLTLSTLYFLISHLIGGNTWMDDLVSGFSDAASDNNIELPLILTWFSKNFAYTNLLLLPVFSFASYISFSGLGRNYLEHIVLNSYITGEQTIFYLIFIILKSVSDSNFFEYIPIIISISYTFWVFWQFFSEGSRIINIFRSITTYVIYIIFTSGLLFLLMTV